jgi:hypothetical protein
MGAKTRRSGNVDGGIVPVEQRGGGNDADFVLWVVGWGSDEGHEAKESGEGGPELIPPRVTLAQRSIDLIMRLTLLPFALLPFSAPACTSFKVTADGRTFIGCNEDAWSINAQVRFEQGHDGQYGAIHFGHFNGSPLRTMTDQMGMNEAGLVYDGLGIPIHHTAARPGLSTLHLDDLIRLVLRTCADVHEAATVFRRYDRSAIPHAMLYLADRNGDYLIVENDTLIEGHDPWYAVGNWRMSTCADPAAIPIPRLQAGRALLSEGTDASLEHATRVLESMKACRSRMGEGTLFSALFDPALGKAHLFFYHDFGERVTFDLKEELAKGDHAVEMASLFSERPEYAALLSYRTPFHQPWLFWTLVAVLCIALLAGVGCGFWFLRDSIRLIRKHPGSALVTALLSGLLCVALAVLLSVLLLNESPYYFGLADVHPALGWLPLIIVAMTAGLFMVVRRSGVPRWLNGTLVVLIVPMVGLLAYWQMLWP